jgi:hypothetical protein
MKKSFTVFLLLFISAIMILNACKKEPIKPTPIPEPEPSGNGIYVGGFLPTDLSVSSNVVLGSHMPPFCIDEGCPQNGTKHICVSGTKTITGETKQ